MQTFYIIFSGFLLLGNMLPLINNPHWFFRVFEFAKIQLFFLEIVCFALGWWLFEPTPLFYGIQSALLVWIVYNAIVLVKFLPIYSYYTKTRLNPNARRSESITVVSANVYQFNTQYQRFIDLIEKVKPDIFLTLESNQAWEDALKPLESQYPYSLKIPLENTYGMHLYSSLKLIYTHANFFVSDDLPSVEAEVQTRDGFTFYFFGVHPSPPSPTEEDTSEERDGELLSVAKKVKLLDNTTLVIGDFNNVAWARSSVLFKKLSGLIDPRVGRGFVSTFHADYRLLRFPLDQVFHSTDIVFEELKTLEHFGSDHLALFCKFYISVKEQHEAIEGLTPEQKQEVKQMIEDGRQADNNREEFATE